MNKVNKVNYIIEELENLFPKVPVPLNHKDPYTLLIAVLLSAQCTDERVNQITPILFKKADNPYDMIKLSVEEIKENYEIMIQFLKDYKKPIRHNSHQLNEINRL